MGCSPFPKKSGNNLSKMGRSRTSLINVVRSDKRKCSRCCIPIRSTAEKASADSANETRTPLARKAEINCRIRDSIVLIPYIKLTRASLCQQFSSQIILGSQPDFGYGLLSSDFVKFNLNLKIVSSSKMDVARLGSIISATSMVGIQS